MHNEAPERTSIKITESMGALVARSDAIKNWAPPEKTIMETIRVVQTLKPEACSKYHTPGQSEYNLNRQAKKHLVFFASMEASPSILLPLSQKDSSN